MTLNQTFVPGHKTKPTSLTGQGEQAPLHHHQQAPLLTIRKEMVSNVITVMLLLNNKIMKCFTSTRYLLLRIYFDIGKTSALMSTCW